MTTQRANSRPAGGTVSPIAVVQAAIERCLETEAALLCRTDMNDRQRADRAMKLSQVADDAATWWAVLAGHVYDRPADLPSVFGVAAIAGKRQAESSARFWAETAQFWQDRANGRARDDDAGSAA